MTDHLIFDRGSVAARDDAGQVVREYIGRTVGGQGRAGCACGWLSATVYYAASTRKAAHKDHVAALTLPPLRLRVAGVPIPGYTDALGIRDAMSQLWRAHSAGRPIAEVLTVNDGLTRDTIARWAAERGVAIGSIDCRA